MARPSGPSSSRRGRGRRQPDCRSISSGYIGILRVGYGGAVPPSAHAILPRGDRRTEMRDVKILCITRISAADRERIEAVDPAIRFTDAGGWLDGEYRETWPEYAVSRYVPRNS